MVLIHLSFLLLFGLASCSELTQDSSQSGTSEGENNEEVVSTKITITVNGISFDATLSSTDAAKAFAAMLPVTLKMSDLNSNEKYCYIDESLPTNSYRPGTIRNGDLMLYGSNCVVIFYETFSSSYSYTDLGRIDNPEGLAEALGQGSVSVSFDLK